MFNCPSLVIMFFRNVDDVAGVHLAGVIRHGGGQVDGSDDGHAVFDDGLAGVGQFAVAAALGRQIDDHRSGRHGVHHFAW